MVYTIITLLIPYIHYVKMQLNDVIKGIGWYWAFVALLIHIDIAKIASILILVLVSVTYATNLYS